MSLNNSVRLRGNLVADPEVVKIKTAADPNEEITKVTIRLAVNNGKTRAGADRPATFVDVQAFRRRAEILAEYLHKGDELYIDGELMLDSWTAADGSNRSKLYVSLNDFNFGRKKSATPTDAPVWTDADTAEIVNGDPEDSLYDDVASSLV